MGFLVHFRVILGMINYHTMAKSKIAITVDEKVLANVDSLVRAGRYPNRSRGFEAAAEAAAWPEY